MSDHAHPLTGHELTRTAVSATLHCLTGCAIGEVLGMVIGTALGWGDWPTIGLAVVLAFFFGYALTVGPVLRSGLPFRSAVKVALAADTVSILVMEIVDNAVMLTVPGAMDAGVGNGLFWGALAFALAVAFVSNPQQKPSSMNPPNTEASIPSASLHTESAFFQTNFF